MWQLHENSPHSGKTWKSVNLMLVFLEFEEEDIQKPQQSVVSIFYWA